MDELDEILPLIKSEECVFFVGSGLSKIAGCSDWDELVNIMLEDEIIKAKLPTRPPLSNDEILGFCFDEFKTHGQIKKFWGYVAKSLTEKDYLYQRKYKPIIKNLKTIFPFPKIVLTTNIDGLLEKTGLFDVNKVFYKLKEFNLTINAEGIFHIHGYVHDIERSVFIRKKYIARYKDNNDFKSFLTKIAKNNSILFICSGLEEPIRDILLKAKNDKIKHFLLVSDENTDAMSKKIVYESELNVKVVKYGPRAEFSNILSAWIEKNFPVTALVEPEKDITKP